LPEHCVDPGAQTPVQAPITQADRVHAAAVPHIPVGLHVCTPLPEHCVVPGVHDPEHIPFTHAWLVHRAGAVQLPVESQV
jgi:hypothetical protein